MKIVPNWFWLTNLLLLSRLNPVQAQKVSEPEKRYKAAVQLIQIGQYDKAKAELNALTDRESNLAPYASYYSAVASFRQKKYVEARLILKQLMDRYPDWRKLDEARYLFACVTMESGQYEDALTDLQRIGDPELKPDIEKLERYFLSLIKDVNQLKALQKEFPENRTLALTLIDLIQRTSSDKNDLELSDRLTNRFGVPTTAAVSTPPFPATSLTGEVKPAVATKPTPLVRNRSKGYFNVAVLFPFRVNDFDAEKRARANQYLFDLYEGIKLAKTQLQDEGITVNLFAYDIDNSVGKTTELLANPAFAQSDLIVGPLYAEPNRLVATFAAQNGIPLVNPIATSGELITNQSMAYLAQPSLTRQARTVVDFARGLTAVRRAAVYFGAARKDSLLGLAYQTELKKQGIQVVDSRRMGTTTDAMTASLTFTEANKPGYTLLASSDEKDGPRLLEVLSRKNVSGPLVATTTSFDLVRNSMSTFTRRELYLLAPDYIDPTRPAVSAFQENYLAKRNIIPSVFAGQGYDLMLFFGRSLAKNAFQPPARTSLKSDSDDYVLSGFDYTQSNDNQIVPIIKYDDGRFVKANE